MLGLMACEELDEDPPDKIKGASGFFSIAGLGPNNHISWIPSSAEDIIEYDIYRSTDSINFDSITTINKNLNYYNDTNILWMKDYQYKIRGIDDQNNVGNFSEYVNVFTYSSSGLWQLEMYDSLLLCIDEKTYSTEPSFEIVTADTFTSVNDTLGVLMFSECVLDSNSWDGNGWMSFTYTVLTLNTLTGLYDTVTTHKLPEFYTIDFSKPDSGIIYFISGNYPSLMFSHTMTDCNGDSLFSD